MSNGTYVGPLAHLRGQRAMVETIHPNFILAQFDSLLLGRRATFDPRRHSVKRNLGYGWHRFRHADFDVDPDLP